MLLHLSSKRNLEAISALTLLVAFIFQFSFVQPAKDRIQALEYRKENLTALLSYRRLSVQTLIVLGANKLVLESSLSEDYIPIKERQNFDAEEIEKSNFKDRIDLELDIYAMSLDRLLNDPVIKGDESPAFKECMNNRTKESALKRDQGKKFIVSLGKGVTVQICDIVQTEIDHRKVEDDIVLASEYEKSLSIIFAFLFILGSVIALLAVLKKES